MPADRALNLGIALPNSTSAADAIANFPANLATGGTYVVMAAGVVGATGATAFNLFINGNAREAAGTPAFALVSGSPIQFGPRIQSFLAAHRFPPLGLYLRSPAPPTSTTLLGSWFISARMIGCL